MRFVSAIGLLIGFLFAAAPARAEQGGFRLGVDLEYAVPVSDELDGGPGAGLRLGHELDLTLLSLTPEIGGTYHSLSGDLSPRFYRGVAGLRLRFLKVLEPGVYAHVGVAHTSLDLDLPGVDDPSWTDWTYDVGGTLDFTLLPLIELGIHGGYTYVAPEESDDDGLDWVNLGLHATLAF